MTGSVRVDIATPIGAIEVLDSNRVAQALRSKATEAQTQQMRGQLTQACAALNKAAAELEACRQSLFSSHRESIVRLSLEIAAKILAKDVAEGNYAIEKIVADALQSAPPARQMTIRLNPDDLKTFEKAMAEQNITLPPHAEVAADWAVNPADCVIESEAGTVDYMIDEHLRSIGEALLHSEQTA